MDVPLDVEPEYLNSQVILPLDSLLARVELFALVYVLATCVAPPEFIVRERPFDGEMMRHTYIEKGAMRRTTCCELLGCLLREMSSGSKSGGKYLLRTMSFVSIFQEKRSLFTYLYARTWWLVMKRERG